MSARELVVLGTSSQVPTRCRNHHAAFLRWGATGFLFDPGEGTQRQMTRHGVRASAVHHLCLTHFHGDHCLGVPGVVQRMALDRVEHPVHAHFPASGRVYWDRLRWASIFDDRALDVRAMPIEEPGVVFRGEDFTLEVRPLEHRVPTYGYRLVEDDAVNLVPERLEAVGLRGPAVGALVREGRATTPSGQVVRIEDVGRPRPGQIFAFIMDTRPCEGAEALAEGADLLVTESTFLADEAALAREYFHMTTVQAATLARDAGARKLVITHFSQRHPRTALYEAEARGVFPETVAVEDGDVVPVPERVRPRA
jgi:ribonuclease Z